MFQIGDLLVLKETSADYENTDIAEKVMLIVEVGSSPYDYYTIDFCFTKAPNSSKVVRTKKFIEDYYKIYEPKV